MDDKNNTESLSSDNENQTPPTANNDVTPPTTPPSESVSEPSAPAAADTDVSAPSDADANPTPDEPVADKPAEPGDGIVTSEHGRRGSKGLIWGLVVLLLLAGGYAAYKFMPQKDATNQSATTTKKVVDIPLVRVGSIYGPIGVDSLFPNPAPANLATQINAQVYEGLVGFSNQKIVPLLASSWTNPDSKTWVFTLKKDVKFQNGKVMTAQDVKTSLDNLMQDENWGFYLQTLSDVSVTGDNQVTIKTSAPDSLLLNRLTFGFVSSKNADGTLSGTGAYTVDAAGSKTETATKLVAFDGYHQGKPRTRVIEFTAYDSTSDLNKALTDGKVDVAEVYKNNTLKAQLLKKGFVDSEYENSGSYGLLPNTASATSPLSKKDVREALAYAVDRADYEKKSDGTKLGTQYVIPKTVVGYDATAKFPLLDVTKSKSLQTAAGYPNGVPLTFLYIEGIQSDAPIVIDELKAAGFKVTPKPMPTPKDFVTAAQTGNYDLISGTYTSDLGDGTDVFAGLLSSDGAQFPFYSNPSFDKMLTDAASTFEPADHIKKVQVANKYIADNYLFIPISDNSNMLFYPKNYTYHLESTTGVDGAYYWQVGKQE